MDYREFAQISIRICAISFLITGILELLMSVTAVLLVSRGWVPQELVAQETWFLQSVFCLFGGTFLYARSKSLGATIVDSLFGPERSDTVGSSN